MSEEANEPGGEQQQAPPQVPVDLADMETLYANFFRVTGTPEELVLDFGLNTQLMAPGGQEQVKLNQRLVLSFYTAKRLLNALSWAMNRHESTFGVVETDFQRRMRPGAGGQR
jgi:Protein of unknown function (DUF3467)